MYKLKRYWELSLLFYFISFLMFTHFFLDPTQRPKTRNGIMTFSNKNYYLFFEIRNSLISIIRANELRQRNQSIFLAPKHFFVFTNQIKICSMTN